ncbi:MAG: type II 3-dehydroquinate dehydratase [Chloroflexi bacterium]|nr:type II 3-dehydroquinate dehydratase [Chloroflexota bacterium]
MKRIIVINGPNLNLLGKRNKNLYGVKTIDDLNNSLKNKAIQLSIEVISFQSNHEGALIDFIQSNPADGIIINPGALTHYGYSLRDALEDAAVPVIEVHLSNIHSREEWRQKSVISTITKGQIVGLGWRSYLAALDILTGMLTEEKG